jgi:hypothetical protein
MYSAQVVRRACYRVRNLTGDNAPRNVQALAEVGVVRTHALDQLPVRIVGVPAEELPGLQTNFADGAAPPITAAGPGNATRFIMSQHTAILSW